MGVKAPPAVAITIAGSNCSVIIIFLGAIAVPWEKLLWAENRRLVKVLLR